MNFGAGPWPAQLGLHGPFMFRGVQFRISALFRCLITVRADHVCGEEFHACHDIGGAFFTQNREWYGYLCLE